MTRWSAATASSRRSWLRHPTWLSGRTSTQPELADLRESRPVPVHVSHSWPGPIDRGDLQAGRAEDLAGGLRPGLAADAGDQREAPVPGQVLGGQIAGRS